MLSLLNKQLFVVAVVAFVALLFLLLLLWLLIVSIDSNGLFRFLSMTAAVIVESQLLFLC